MEAWPFFILQSPRIPKQPAMATCQVLMATFVIGALTAMLRYRQTPKAAFELDDSNSRRDGL
jgi:hypothetical protein